MNAVSGFSAACLVLACSGPGAWKLMTEADIYGSWCAFWTLLLLVPTIYLLFRSGHPVLAAAHLLLLVFHPSWTISAWQGDCGELKRWLSTAFVVLSALALPESIIIARFFPREFPWRRSKKEHAGTCSHCGYDLRATPDRCPECGTVPAKSVS